MELYLARHGDTFNAGDKVVWVGAKNDLELTTKGEEQARAIASYLLKTNVKPVIYCGPLRRTTKMASIISDMLSINESPKTSLALNEIDYGKWSGLTNSEITQEFGEDKLKAWEQRGDWPKDCSWGGSPEIITQNILLWLREIQNTNQKQILGITSNGTLRFFWKLASNSAPEKVKTGNLCKLHITSEIVKIEYWNKSV